MVVDATAETAGVPTAHVTIVVGDDFRSEVRRILSETGHEEAAQRFDVERIGGQAAAKNLPLTLDYSCVAVVFDNSFIRDHEGLAAALRVFIVAHELVHPLLDRSRSVAGVETEATAELVVGDSAIGAARWMVQRAADEYRADMVASAVLASLVQIGDGGHAQPARMVDLLPAYLGEPGAFLEGAYPRWPGLVERRPLDVGLIWSTVVNDTAGLLIALAHGQAAADAAGLQGPLELCAVADLPATKLYAGELWRRLRDRITSTPMLLMPAQFAIEEEQFLDDTTSAVFDFWAALGVHPEQLPNGRLHIGISAPRRTEAT